MSKTEVSLIIFFFILATLCWTVAFTLIFDNKTAGTLFFVAGAYWFGVACMILAGFEGGD
jgi:hypothetical protein